MAYRATHLGQTFHSQFSSDNTLSQAGVFLVLQIETQGANLGFIGGCSSGLFVEYTFLKRDRFFQDQFSRWKTGSVKLYTWYNDTYELKNRKQVHCIGVQRICPEWYPLLSLWHHHLQQCELLVYQSRQLELSEFRNCLPQIVFSLK